ETLRELSIASPNYEIFAQEVSCGDPGTDVPKARVGHDLPSNDRNIVRIERINKRELALRNDDVAGREIEVVHQTVFVRRQGVVIPPQPIVDGQLRRQFERIHGVEPEFLICHGTVHERIGSLTRLWQAEQKVGKAIISLGKTAIETEAAVVRNDARMEPEHRGLTTELHHVFSLLPGQAVFKGERMIVVFDTTGDTREAAYAVDVHRRRSRFVVVAGIDTLKANGLDYIPALKRMLAALRGTVFEPVGGVTEPKNIHDCGRKEVRVCDGRLAVDTHAGPEGHWQTSGQHKWSLPLKPSCIDGVFGADVVIDADERPVS